MTDIAPAQWFPTKTKIIDDDADSDINMAVYLHRIEEEEYDAELARALALSKQTAEWEAWARASPMSTASSTIAISRTASTAVSTASSTAISRTSSSEAQEEKLSNKRRAVEPEVSPVAGDLSHLRSASFVRDGGIAGFHALPIPNPRTEPGYEFNRLSSISSDLDDDAVSISSVSTRLSTFDILSQVSASSQYSTMHEAKTRLRRALSNASLRDGPSRRLSLRDREERPPDVELLLYRGVFINSRRCTVCRNRMKQPTSGNETGRLHFSCSHCKATHCRGCGSLSHCPQNPSERHSCLIPQNCCSQIRAVAIYEALCLFDDAYRSSTTTKTLGWEQAALKCLQSLHKLLSPLLDDNMSDTDSFRSRHPSMQLHPSIKCLLTMSHLPQAMTELLTNLDYSTWMSKSDLYEATLALMNILGRCGLGDIMSRRLHKLDRAKSCGIREWMEKGDGIVWLDKATPLSDLVPPLATVRTRLQGFSENSAWDRTKRKATGLCDAILSVTLQRTAGYFD